mgnify:CR=1 FL=1
MRLTTKSRYGTRLILDLAEEQIAEAALDIVRSGGVKALSVAAVAESPHAGHAVVAPGAGSYVARQRGHRICMGTRVILWPRGRLRPRGVDHPIKRSSGPPSRSRSVRRLDPLIAFSASRLSRSFP